MKNQKNRHDDKIFYLIMIILIIILSNLDNIKKYQGDSEVVVLEVEKHPDKNIDTGREVNNQEIIKIPEIPPIEETDQEKPNNDIEEEPVPVIPNEISNQEIKLEITRDQTILRLSWTEYQDNLKYYKIIRSTKNPDPKYPQDKFIETIPDSQVTTYDDDEYKDGFINYYVVAAVKNDMSVKYSNVVTIDFRNPEQQVSSLEGSYDGKSVNLKWDQPDRPIKYFRVVRSTINPFPTYPQDSFIKTMNSINETEFTDIGPFKEDTYFYGITITFSDNTIGYSNPVQINII